MATSSTVERNPVLAVPPGTRPEIVCPSWCSVPYESHFGDLALWEGLVIHHSAERGGVDHSRCAYPDGTPDKTEPPLVYLRHRMTDGIGLEEVEALARQILAAVEEARS